MKLKADGILSLHSRTREPEEEMVEWEQEQGVDNSDGEKKNEKKIHALDLYVIFSIVSLIVYSIAAYFVAYSTGITLDTLTTCFFGFFGGEIVVCAMIKRLKLKEGDGAG